MEMAALVDQYYDKYIGRYGDIALPGHLKTLSAILRCRTHESGELYVRCPACDHTEWRPISCGNRHCPKCQNHNTSQWIDKQQKKLLPVPYFMATLTLPRELRPLAWFNQKAVYTLLFLLPRACSTMDKIVDRCALTIYPCLLRFFLLFCIYLA